MTWLSSFGRGVSVGGFSGEDGVGERVQNTKRPREIVRGMVIAVTGLVVQILFWVGYIVFYFKFEISSVTVKNYDCTCSKLFFYHKNISRGVPCRGEAYP